MFFGGFPFFGGDDGHEQYGMNILKNPRILEIN